MKFQKRISINKKNENEEMKIENKNKKANDSSSDSGKKSVNKENDE